jgi:hypothetical protein
VQKALLANPCAFSYNHSVFIISFENGIVTYVDMLAYFDIFRMKDEYTGFKDHPLAERTEIGYGELPCPM